MISLFFFIGTILLLCRLRSKSTFVWIFTHYLALYHIFSLTRFVYPSPDTKPMPPVSHPIAIRRKIQRSSIGVKTQMDYDEEIRSACNAPAAFCSFSSLLSIYRSIVQSVYWSGIFITRNNKHLAETMNFLKFMFSEEGMRLGEWGVPEEDWTLSQDGYPVFLYNTQDQEYITANGIFYWGLLSGTAVTEGLKNYDPDTLGTPVMIEMKQYVVYMPALGLLTPPADSDEQVILTKLDEMVVNEQVNMHLADSEEGVETAYYAILEKVKILGVKQLVQWANEKYAELSA